MLKQTSNNMEIEFVFKMLKIHQESKKVARHGAFLGGGLPSYSMGLESQFRKQVICKQRIKVGKFRAFYSNLGIESAFKQLKKH